MKGLGEQKRTKWLLRGNIQQRYVSLEKKELIKRATNQPISSRGVQRHRQRRCRVGRRLQLRVAQRQLRLKRVRRRRHLWRPRRRSRRARRQQLPSWARFRRGQFRMRRRKLRIRRPEGHLIFVVVVDVDLVVSSFVFVGLLFRGNRHNDK